MWSHVRNPFSFSAFIILTLAPSLVALQCWAWSFCPPYKQVIWFPMMGQADVIIEAASSIYCWCTALVLRGHVAMKSGWVTHIYLALLCTRNSDLPGKQLSLLMLENLEKNQNWMKKAKNIHKIILLDFLPFWPPLFPCESSEGNSRASILL